MDMRTYLIESERTVAKSFYLEPMDWRSVHELHAAIGISTEMEEFIKCYKYSSGVIDLVNASEELADICWYNAILARFYKIDLSQPDQKSWYSNVGSNDEMFVSFTEEMVMLSGRLLDLQKKKLFYNKKYDQQKVVSIVKDIHTHVWCFCTHVLNIKFETILQNNIDKLRKRFPDKFTNELANNRNLEAERKELEKGL